ncbi:MAG: hypothetical protein ACD_3C00170G0004 [uncultured bacterium (gcode 4)]|uniref:Uncharacterized protein n=1 Tax=uncultured bacterium (gcode 4) TaxID=1234023 RepID=K2FXK8_9BACT|nr:MAG: hypothetical protein ACD_3C00170G0004 [uncultured bacterium (gcode 4)]
MKNSTTQHPWTQIGKINQATAKPDDGTIKLWEEVKEKVGEALEVKTYWVPEIPKYQSELFIKLGFKILKIDDNSYRYHTVTLPENWKMWESERGGQIKYILDEKWRKRVFITESVRFDDPRTVLINRYEMKYMRVDEERVECFVYDTTDSEDTWKTEDYKKLYHLIFDAKKWRQKYTNDEEKKEMEVQNRELTKAIQEREKRCRLWLTENLPDHNNPLAYWDKANNIPYEVPSLWIRDKEMFKKVWFIFPENVVANPWYTRFVLPDWWARQKDNEDSMLEFIFDEKWRKRVKVNFRERFDMMYTQLLCRYNIDEIQVNDEERTVFLYDRDWTKADPKKLEDYNIIQKCTYNPKTQKDTYSEVWYRECFMRMFDPTAYWEE